MFCSWYSCSHWRYLSYMRWRKKAAVTYSFSMATIVLATAQDIHTLRHQGQSRHISWSCNTASAETLRLQDTIAVNLQSSSESAIFMKSGPQTFLYRPNWGSFMSKSYLQEPHHARVQVLWWQPAWQLSQIVAAWEASSTRLAQLCPEAG